MKIDKDYEAAINRLMQRAKISDHRLVMGGKHLRLVFTRDGREHRYTVPVSPSDHRAIKNMERDLRQLLGLTVVSTPPQEILPPVELVEAVRERISRTPPTHPTPKDSRALDLLDQTFTSAVTIGQRAGAQDPMAWGVERLERLRALGLAETDGSGRYRVP
ncbi:hypothetical protein [Pararhodospirillum photometricum]|uniref:Uncharacterized protein n=1 Tax=Pararhodospirillum photometricum DSM 122 TaxID=1150469 RepID=H6SRW3_PARPM|nr:hypothetical protein [Pararhodospirillum photometricum]CCG07642.1 unnamed protein product [Pararhodospirillum photometricum DSM 122]